MALHADIRCDHWPSSMRRYGAYINTCTCFYSHTNATPSAHTFLNNLGYRYCYTDAIIPILCRPAH